MERNIFLQAILIAQVIFLDFLIQILSFWETVWKHCAKMSAKRFWIWLKTGGLNFLNRMLVWQELIFFWIKLKIQASKLILKKKNFRRKMQKKIKSRFLQAIILRFLRRLWIWAKKILVFSVLFMTVECLKFPSSFVFFCYLSFF